MKRIFFNFNFNTFVDYLCLTLFIIVFIFVGINFSYAQVAHDTISSTPTVVVDQSGNTGVFKLIDISWMQWYALFYTLFEAVVRIIPTAKSYSIIRLLLTFFDKFVPDQNVAGGKFE